MDIETNFMNFESLTKLIEEHKKETHPYKRYEFDSTSYTLLLIDINNLIKENQELNKKYLNAVADYETTMAEKEQLKKQLEEINKMIEKCGFVNIEQVMLNYCGLLVQQKEFIKYLEDEIEKATTNPYTKLSEYGMNRIHIYKEILQKYKRIIGENDV